MSDVMGASSISKNRFGLPVRGCIQTAALGLFFCLFFHVSWPYAKVFHPRLLSDKEWLPAELFLWLDPLVGISTSITARTVNVALFGTALIFLASVLVPRGFCGYVCPLGTLIDLFDRLVGRRLRWLKIETAGRWKYVRYYVLAAVLVASGWGVLLSGYVSAIPVLTRGMAFTLGPLQLGWMRNWSQVRAVGWAEWLSVGLFATVLLGGLAGRRFWCRCVCPSGALISLFSLFRATQRKVDNTCVECGLCTKVCPFDAIDADYTTRRLDCAWCRTCVGVCPVGAIKFTGRFGRENRKEPDTDVGASSLLKKGGLNCDESGATAGLSSSVFREFAPCTAGQASSGTLFQRAARGASRRGFLVAAAVGTAALAVSGQSSGAKGGRKLLRPPGSVPEPEFLDRCIRCGQCYQVCPGPVLHPAGGDSPFDALWTPVPVLTHAGCHQDCNFCTQVCPTGAIRPLSIEEKRKTSMGLAIINCQTCLPHAGRQDCRVCVDECNAAGYRAIELRPIQLSLENIPEGVFSDYELEQMSRIEAPFIDPQACVGCGLCEYRCHAALVKQKKLLGESAVRVVAERVDR